MKKSLLALGAGLLLGALTLSVSAMAEEGSEVWYIWGEQMAVEGEAADYDFEGAHDPADFRPCLTPYLLENQEEVKGNIIVCSGGADRFRSNDSEGIPCCEYLNSIGYNAYLLDYRVQPYASADATLDVQRAIRYVKYVAEEKGIGSIDKLGTIGFSAGAMHCYAQAIAFADHITPDSVYADYVCDEVDQEEALVQVVGCIYAAGMPHDTQGLPVDIANPVLLLEEGDPNTPSALPAFFFAGGSGHFASGFCVTAYQTMNPLTESELHMYGGINGPFAMGDKYDGSDQMRSQLEAFLGYEFGYRERFAKE